MFRVAYITSGKIGIHRFTFNELVELEKRKTNFTLCLTQLNSGPWMPKDKWDTIIASKKRTFWSILKIFFKNDIKFLRNLFNSIRMGVFPYFIVALYFYDNLKKKKISSIHCQMGDKKLYIGYFLKQFLGLPLTVNIHAHELYQREVYDRPNIMNWLFCQCDKIITISNFNKHILKKRLKVNEDKIEVMRLFPETNQIDKFRTKKKILIVANWAEKKGYKVLFDAISKLDRSDFILWVVGGSYYSDNSIDLNELIKESNLENKISLLGRHGGEILDIIFSSCDIFCLPSLTEYYDDGNPAEREGIPVSLMEAMAWGKPVISTFHAGIPELVEEILVKENDVDELKDAIEYLLDHPEKWTEMGKRNQEIIKEKYNPENVKILSDIFKKISK
jgi:colanic acid/amylovoran biosynthesis glycosyltransferase